MALTIDPDTVCFLIIKAREFDAMVDAGDLGSGDNPADDDERAALLDTQDNAAGAELFGALRSLSDDERIELVALLWIGRGDYEVGQWEEAMADAGGRPEMRRADLFLDVPLLADYLEEGLTRLGYSCAEVEAKHL